MTTTTPDDLFKDNRPTVMEVAGTDFLEVCRRQRDGELVITSVQVLKLGRYRVNVRYVNTAGGAIA